ncbi:MAG: DUF4932 domain-containing protein [Armatimonadetes bacterium]|nr:DUF4932 domain-containing protein [Armatimonadota bacterium]
MIHVELDKRIRLISSVLLLTKFVNEHPGWKPHPLKVQTIEHLRGFEDHPCVIASRLLAESYWMSAFHCYGVMLKWVPGVMVPKDDAQPDGYDVSAVMKDFEQQDYVRLLQSFYLDTELESFWTQTGDLWDEVARDCRRILQDCRVEEFFDLFFGVSDHPMVLVPNPLDPAAFGFGPNDGTTAYCIVGTPTVPPESPAPVTYDAEPGYLRNMAFHEFAHTLYGDLHKQCPDLTPLAAHLETKVNPRGWFADMYDSWEIRLDEILIRATTALFLSYVEGEASAEAALEKERQEHGLDIVIPVYSLLREYLQARQQGAYSGFREYVPVLCGKLAAL